MSSPTSIHREIADCWNRRDFDGLRSLCHSEYTYTGGDGNQMTGGPDAALDIAGMWASAFPDGRLEVRGVYTQGNVAIAEMVGRGTHAGHFAGVAPTGRSVEIVLCNVIELRDGKAYRERQYLDTLSVLTQIGAASAPGRTAGA
jgi:steroid delta-isomerase-like uncharacterized protein